MSNVAMNLKSTNEKQAEERARRIKTVSEKIMNTPGGFSVKELCVELGYSSEAVRRYVRELVAEGDVVAGAKEGKTVIYIWNQGEKKPVTKEEIEEAFPERAGGKEFDPDTVKPAIHVNQGDVVWVSSRSGDGMFFRYLILVPWEKKATVIGIFPEGHPVLNINDPRFVPIGEFQGENLYADLTNICSRAYAQFGEEAGKVTDAVMAEVKSRVARIYRIKVMNGDAIESVAKKYQKSLAELKKQNDILKDDNEKFHQIAQNLAKECDEKKEAWEEMNKLANDSIAEIAKATETINEQTEEIKSLRKDKNDYGIQLDQMGKDLVDLEAENDRLKKQLAEKDEQHTESDVVFTEDTRERIDALLYHIARLEERIEGKDALIAQQKETIAALAKTLEQALVALR